jgi:Tol biopolymer transport system component/uncharacterized protein YraI
MKVRWSAGRRRLAAGLFVMLIVAMAIAATSRISAGAATSAPIDQQVTEQAVVRPAGAEMFDVPDGTVIAQLEPVSFVTLFGRTEDSTWVVASTGDGQTGWVRTKDLVTYNTDSLPVMLADEPIPSEGAEPPSAMSAETPLPPASTPTPTATPVPPTPTPVPPTATPTNSPTPTPSPTPVPPTATPTLVAPPLAAAPATPSVRSSRVSRDVVGVVGVNGADLLAEPSGEALAVLPVGSALALTGRTEDSAWLEVRLADGRTGWVAQESIVAFNIEGLPVAGAGTAAEPAASEDVVPAPPVESLEADGMVEVESQTPESVVEATVVPAAGKPSGIAGGVGRIEAAARDSGIVSLVGGNLNIRSGPGTEFPIVAKAAANSRLDILARSETGEWLQVALADSGETGWANAQFIMTDLPVKELPAAGADGGAVTQPDAESPVLVLPTVTPQAAQSVAPTLVSKEPMAAMPVETAMPVDRSAASSGPSGLQGNLVFQDGRNNIYRYELDSGDLRLLTNGYDPAFSPDGAQVVFTRGGGSDNGLYVINLDGSGERKLWGEGEILRSPKWSPDGKWIVYSRFTGSYKCFDLQFIGCKSLRQLIAEFPFLVIPEVRKKFLEDAERLEFPNWGLSRVSINGDQFRDIAALDSAIAPDWNEAGIAYQSAAGIDVTEDTPTGNTRAIFQEDWDHDPDWQPDGGFMVFTSREGSHWEIWRITPEGTGVVALTRPQTTLVDELPSNVAPAWSFDGEKIVYLSSRDDTEDTGPWRLWVMNADGSGKQRIPIDVEIDYSYAAEQVVDWGPPLP